MIQELKSSYPHAYGNILAMSSAFGAGFYLVFFRLALEGASFLSIVWLLIGSAAVLCTLWQIVQGLALKGINKSELICTVVLALCTVVGNSSVAFALELSQPALVSVVLQSQIFMIALLEFLALRERLHPSLIIGSLIAVAGIVYMRIAQIEGVDSGEQLIGILWALSAAFTYSIMLVVTRVFIEDIDTTRVNTLRLWLAFVGFAAWPGVVGGALECQLHHYLYAAIASAAGLVISRLFLMNSVRYISATQTKLISLVAPIFTVVIAWIILDVFPSSREVYGGLIILAGVLLPLVWRLQRERRLRMRDGVDQ